MMMMMVVVMNITTMMMIKYDDDDEHHHDIYLKWYVVDKPAAARIHVGEAHQAVRF
jgi:hypothetical protein